MQQSQKIMEGLREQVRGRILPGDDLVAVGAVGIKGARRLLLLHREQLRGRLPERFLHQAAQRMSREEERLAALCGGTCCTGDPEKSSLPDDREPFTCLNPSIFEGNPAGKEAPPYTVHGWIPTDEEGFLSALWKLAEVSGAGLEADLLQVPVFQETVEICEALGEDPLRLPCGSGYLTGVSGGWRLVRDLESSGISCAVIGSVQRGRRRLLYAGENVRFLERPVLK